MTLFVGESIAAVEPGTAVAVAGSVVAAAAAAVEPVVVVLEIAGLAAAFVAARQQPCET